ncbi:hypothetical protein RhiirA4_489231 [Rhizophagus irregularis]|uniref:Uncharacterized protein n=1 Tax=Rhizophagus irregularis TaxID=588596 RepID=A0A2I1HUL8_9GLOM|nr:hypothetical protein RhiirA4_489231 [Rhizophagus irregularis]
MFQKYGCVEDLLSLESGQSRILKVEDTKYLESLLKEKVDWYLWELQSEMELLLGPKLLSKPAKEHNENERLNFYNTYVTIFSIAAKRGLCLNGLLAYMIQEGPMNSTNYNYFVEHILLNEILESEGSQQ